MRRSGLRFLHPKHKGVTVKPDPWAHGGAAHVAERMQSDSAFLVDVAKRLTQNDFDRLTRAATAAAAAPVDPITMTQWRKLFFRSALPFFGFGICDNLIMIFVGDTIDASFGVTMGFSTMIAAGLGQAVSDGAGITIQGFIDTQSDRLGLPRPGLTDSQARLRFVVGMVQLFRTMGIVLGCLCGLFPVWLWDAGNRPRLFDLLLTAMPEEQRRELSSKATYVSFQEGDHICTFGKEMEGLFTILSGEVKVVGRDDGGGNLEFHSYGAGFGIGVVELVFDHACVADVIATTSVNALRISRKDFQSSSRLGEIKKVVTEFIVAEDSYVPYRLRYLRHKEDGTLYFVGFNQKK